MTRDEFLDKQYTLSVQAGMNQRYHQRYSGWWWGWDTATKIVTAGAAFASALLALACAYDPTNEPLARWAVGVAIAAACAAIAVNVAPFGAWEQQHRDFLRQWTDLRGDVDGLLYGCVGEPDDRILCELSKLEAKSHRICGEEPSPDDVLIKKCFADEDRSRKVAA